MGETASPRLITGKSLCNLEYLGKKKKKGYSQKTPRNTCR